MMYNGSTSKSERFQKQSEWFFYIDLKIVLLTCLKVPYGNPYYSWDNIHVCTNKFWTTISSVY